jgi:hypothetical protein
MKILDINNKKNDNISNNLCVGNYSIINGHKYIWNKSHCISKSMNNSNKN